MCSFRSAKSLENSLQHLLFMFAVQRIGGENSVLAQGAPSIGIVDQFIHLFYDQLWFGYGHDDPSIIAAYDRSHLWQIGGQYRNMCTEVIEQFVREAEAVVQVRVLVQRKSQIGIARILHHLHVRHSFQKTHASLQML